jgi:hypothetical protein
MADQDLGTCASEWRRGNHGCGTRGWCLCCAVTPGTRSRITEYIKSKWPDRVTRIDYPEVSPLQAFNDHVDTTIEEVLDALRV